MTYECAAEADADLTQYEALRSNRVELEAIGLTEHGRRYQLTYADEILVEGRRNPIFDAYLPCWRGVSPGAWRYGAQARQAPTCNLISIAALGSAKGQPRACRYCHGDPVQTYLPECSFPSCGAAAGGDLRLAVGLPTPQPTSVPEAEWESAK